MKRIYSKPEVKVVKIKPKNMLMTSGAVGPTSVRMKWDSDADAGAGLSRRSSFSSWDDEE